MFKIAMTNLLRGANRRRAAHRRPVVNFSAHSTLGRSAPDGSTRRFDQTNRRG
jgi:hypothetical protein